MLPLPWFVLSKTPLGLLRLCEVKYFVFFKFAAIKDELSSRDLSCAEEAGAPSQEHAQL